MHCHPFTGAQAIERYAFIRDAYLQHRNYLIKGKIEDTGALYIDDGVEEPVLGLKKPIKTKKK